jgi:hypothetical protein
MTAPTRLECSMCTKNKENHGIGRRARSLPAGRVPRIARLLALARKFDNLLRQQVVANCAALARLGHVSRARMTQILNLLYLAPDIQEAILFLPVTVRGRDAIRLCQLQKLTQILDWSQQRTLWRQLLSVASCRPERLWRERTSRRTTLPHVAAMNAVKNCATVPSTGKDYDG